MSNYDIINNSIQYKLHSVLKINHLWPQFIEAIAQEVATIKDHDDLTRFYNDIYSQLEDGNLDIANKFGYTPNLVLNNSLDYIRRQSESIPFRIAKKTTYIGYDINFKMVDRIGEVYNLFWNGNKLIRAVKWGQTFSSLESGFDYTKPFTNLVADRNFSTINLGEAELMDDENYLDEDPPLRMDSSTFVYPTKHLAIEMIIDQLVQRENEDYLLYNNFFKYLEQGTEYNRQVPVVPHNGGQLNIVLSSSGGYDFFNVGSQYSVPDLKLRATIAYLYIVRENIEGLLSLDSVGRTLDEPITWTMDGSDEESTPISINDFKYISVGGGQHNVPNTENSRILNDLSTLVLYYPFDDDDSLTSIKDYSSNGYDGIITGEQKKITGIVGKTVNFDGFTHVLSSVTLIQSNYNIGLWVNLDGNNINQTIFDIGFMKLSYDFSLDQFTLNFNSLSFNQSFSGVDNDTFIELELDDDNKEIRMFINTNLVNVFDISGEIYGGQYDLYIGCDSTLGSYSKGVIDDFFIYLKTFSQSEKEYIYNNKVGIITKLNKFYNRLPLEEVEKNESNSGSWLGVQTYAKANYINDEFAFAYETGIETYMGKTFFNNLTPFRTALNYTRIEGITPVTEKVFDNGNGKFEGTHISGTIDYSTGYYTINTFAINYQVYDQISPTSTISISDAVAPFIQLGTLQVFYSISGTSYIAQDDTAGNIVGTGISSGTIDYTSGVINITFTDTTDGEVFTRYQYKKSAVFNDNDILTMEYYSSIPLDITEVALEDENKNVLVYATFPKLEFNTIENHFSPSFFIRKV